MFRRQDDGEACHSGRNYNESEYNLGLHVASLFVVLAVSSLACAFPLLVLRFPRLRIPARVLFVVRHFGEPVLSVCRILPRLLTKFRYRRLDSHGVRASAPHSIHLPGRPLFI